MQDLIDLLTETGLPIKEAKTYLICLKLGTSPASTIARYSELNRCTAYSILESLIKKGLIYQVEKDTIKYFTAVDPRHFIKRIEEKQRDLFYCRNEILARISEFEAIKNPNSIMPSIKSYTGKTCINKLYNESLNEPFLLINGLQERRNNQFFIRYAPIFLEAKKIIYLAIRENGEIKNIRLTKKDELSSVQNCAPIEIIGKNKLFIIDAEDEYGIEIDQIKIIKEHQDQFHYLWKIKKDPLQ